MALDPSIILSGRGVDVGGAMSAGNALATQTNALRRDNQLADLYQTQGAGLVAGDPNAVNALAAIDPTAALGIKDATRGMAWAEEDRIAAKAEGKRLAEEAMKAKADTLTAEQLAAEKKAISEGLSGAAFFYQKGDEAGYNNFLAQQGMDPSQFDFADFPAHAAMFEGALEAMNGFAPPAGPEWRPATPEEAATYGSAAGQFNTKTGEFKKSGDGNGVTQTITNPDGTTTTIQVGGAAGGAAGGKFTEGQGKDNAYATRAEGALARLDPVADALTNVGNRALEYDPTGLFRGALQGDDFQTAKQAGDEFLQAILRKDTGAAITTQEQDLYGKTYLPQPGDNAAVLKQKKEARYRALNAMKSGMNMEQLAVQERALLASGDTPIPAGGTGDATGGNVTSGGVKWSVSE